MKRFAAPILLVLVAVLAAALPGMAQGGVSVQDTHYTYGSSYGAFIQGDCARIDSIWSKEGEVTSSLCAAVLNSFESCDSHAILSITIKDFEAAQPFLGFLDGTDEIAAGEVWNTRREDPASPYEIGYSMAEVYIKTSDDGYVYAVGNDVSLGETGDPTYITPKAYIFDTAGYKECVDRWLSNHENELSELPSEDLFVREKQGF